MMLEVTKNKEKLYIADTNYYYDINHSCYFNGTTNKKLVHSPLPRLRYNRYGQVNNIYAYFLRKFQNSLPENSMLALDKVYNLMQSRYPEFLSDYFSIRSANTNPPPNREQVDLILNNIKIIDKIFDEMFLKDNTFFNVKRFSFYGLSSAIKEYLSIEKLKTLIPKITCEEANSVLCYTNALDATQEPQLIKWIYKYIIKNTDLYYWYELSDNRPYYRIKQRLQQLVDKCHEMEMPLPEKDFFQAYAEVQKNYIAFKKQRNKKFFENYLKEKSYLQFEDEYFKVVLPTSEEDIKQEAIGQSNCIYSSYLDFLCDGKTNIVFIRDKQNLDKSLITCEIDNRLNIQQYLAKFNQKTKDEKLISFRSQYQEYLNEVMK